MSVVTILFFLAVPFLFLAACAPNQRADRLPNSPHPYVLSDQSTQSVVLAITAKHDLDAVPSPRTTASGTGSSNAGGDVQIQTTPSLGFLPSNTGEPDLGSAGSLSHKHSTLDSWLKNGTSYTIPNPTQPSQCRRSWPIPAGNIDNGAISGDNCLQTQPSPGSQFSNYTAPFPRSGFGNNGRSGPETGCPPVQTVTMPPSTVTLPAQTITVTASQVTATITVTPQTQTQTQTVTVTVTITAGPAPPYPTITSSPGSGLITAQSNMNPTSQGIPLSSLSATAQGVVPLSAPGTGQNSNSTNNVPGTGQLVPSLNILSTGQGTSQSNVPNTAGVNFPAVSSVPPNGTGISTQAGNTVANQPNPITGVPIASSNSPQYFSIPATLASELDTIPLFQPSPAAIPIPSRSGIRGIGTAYAQSVSGSSSNTLTGQFAAPYQNATSGSGLSVPSGSGPVPGIGPIASVINRPASGPIAPGTISASLYQVIGSFMSPPPVVADPTGASKFYPRPNYTNTAPIVNTDPVSVPSGSPAGPSIYPTPIIIGTSAQAAPSSSLNANTSCSTSTQNITVDFSTLLPSSFISSNPDPIYQGLNYTSFTLTTDSTPPHLSAPASTNPKTISVTPPYLSYSLFSISLSCIPSSLTTAAALTAANCTISLYGFGSARAGTGTITTRQVNLTGDATQSFTFDGPGSRLAGLEQISLSAESEGTPMGVGVWGLEYEVVGSC